MKKLLSIVLTGVSLVGINTQSSAITESELPKASEVVLHPATGCYGHRSGVDFMRYEPPKDLNLASIDMASLDAKNKGHATAIEALTAAHVDKYRKDALLKSNRLVLRPLTNGDGIRLHKHCFGQPKVMQYYESGKPYQPEHMQDRMPGWVNRWTSHPLSWWCLFKQGSDGEIDLNQFVGGLGSAPFEIATADYVKPLGRYLQVAIILRQEEWQKGYGKESIMAFAKYAMSVDPEASGLYAPVDPKNEGSNALFGALGRLTEVDGEICGQKRKVYLIKRATIETHS